MSNHHRTYRMYMVEQTDVVEHLIIADHPGSEGGGKKNR